MLKTPRDPTVLEVARRVSYKVDINMEAIQSLIEIRVRYKVTGSKMPEFARGCPTKTLSQDSPVVRFIEYAVHSAKQIPRLISINRLTSFYT
jgi:hypothetical protein